MSNFITNASHDKSLKKRINKIISFSDDLKFLVGFFYFSGWQEVYQSLKENKTVTLKLLIGLEVDSFLSKLVEHGSVEENLSQDDQFNRFMTSLSKAINNDEMDNESFYSQVEFFISMLKENRLIIRKTEQPNHAKLYLFHFNKEQSDNQGRPGEFITGSSNLTRSGLANQNEFNVEIKDYGFPDALDYFDQLWETAIPITEVEQRKSQLLKFIQYKSQVANVTPFEAYALVLKSRLDLHKQKQLNSEVERLLEKKGFKKFAYQIDAVEQALSILDEYNGVIIADVVGLGKSVIAAMITKHYGKRGMVICPPGLIGDRNLNTGWYEYIHDFQLYDWVIESRGKLVEIAETIQDKNIEFLIIDEAHYFRNQDTVDYEALLTICRDRKVILLTATPFNNSPADIFSLLKLFVVPGKSRITIEDNLESVFRRYNYQFKQLSDITKYANSDEPEKFRKAEQIYTQVIENELPIDIKKVRQETKKLANKIKNVISPVLIRRNRLDLKLDHEYSKEIDQLSEVKDPTELFYYLNEAQSDFYDKILSDYFGEKGRFTGAIYQPFSYEDHIKDEEKLGELDNRAFQQQRNLYDFMRRLLVKRFESSFGAFAQSIQRFIKVHKLVLQFIENSKGRYILDRSLIESIYEFSEEEILETLYKFENDLLNKKVPKNNTVYYVYKFKRKEEFLRDIASDIILFEEIEIELNRLDVINHDPKRESIYLEIERILKEENHQRKIIIFSEYVDTIKHIEPYLREKLGEKLLVCDGKVSKDLAKFLNSDFNAQYKGHRTDLFSVLLTSDKLSEGFNLNRAGVIVNYDIPWNPTRVIQRVGRINRIGEKVFDELYIFNFFPSIKGSDIVKSREIASQKMFLIHHTLGEDAKIFDAEEEPTPSTLYQKMNENPENNDELNIITRVRNLYHDISKNYPDVIKKIEDLPARVKTSKSYQEKQLNILRKKGLSLFSHVVSVDEKNAHHIEEIIFEDLLEHVICNFDEPKLKLSKEFWPSYEAVKKFKPKMNLGRSDVSLESRALQNLKVGLKLTDPKEENLIEFIKTLLYDIKNYHTLSLKTLRRISLTPLTSKSSEKELSLFLEEIRWIQNRFGTDYLNKILKRIENQKSEVIIAIENQN